MNDVDFTLGRYLHDGGGETGALMRSIDWAATPLGAVEGWSQALRTMVGLLLRNRFPLILMWGPEFVQFYNDPYRPILGAKHPKAMGQAGPVCWSEIWHVIGPMFQAPLSGEPATWSDDLILWFDRNGFIEETHFKVAYSPVPDETVTPTGIGGVLATVAEISEQIYGERQLRTLRELGARAADAKTPEAACRSAAETLSSDPRDVSFALFYLLDDAGETATLEGVYGLEPGKHPAAPLAFDLGRAGPQTSWPLDAVVAERKIQVIADLARRFEHLPVSEHGESSRTAIVLPLDSPDQPRIYGFFIVGVSPHRALDDGYRSFFEVAASQVVTAIRNARAYLEERRRSEALAEIDRAKSAFFSNVSHEFRTPLTLMLGPTEDALARPDGLMSRAELETVHRNELRLLKLVNALLDFSRIEAGRVLAAYEPTDLSTLTIDLASSFRAAIERAGLGFEVSCPPLAELVYVDREMWEKVVLNLLSNALKFTFEGTIRLTLLEVVGDVELTVQDTGTGIPDAELPHLFDRFHRVEGAKARTHEGSGIGLALVDELIKLQGGQVSVTSTLGQGSTFSVKIRRGRAHVPDRRIEPPSSRTSTNSGTAYVEEALRWTPDSPANTGETNGRDTHELDPTPSARLLVVDDNADMRDYLVRTLAQHWSVDAAANGKLALEVARKTRPAMIITDVMMPELDGFGLLREIRADVELSRTPVMMLSARAGDEARIEGIEAGADDYLVKPFSARELVARIRMHLQLRELRIEGESDRAKLSGLFMNAPAAVALVDGPEFVFELANERYLALVGRRSDILGRTAREVFPELEGQGFFELLAQVYATGEPFITNEAKILLDRRGNGELEELFLNFVYQPYFNSNGRPKGISVFGFDVTDQVLARRAVESAQREAERERELAKVSQAQAESANRAKDDFLAMLGHELRNPLSPILTALELMRLRNDSALLKERAVIERQARHLSRLVDDLLDVSRIAQGKILIKRRPIELAQLIGQSIEVAAPLLEGRRHVLTTKVPTHGFLIDGDESRLVQVFSNLITNAAKYTDSAGQITVEAEREGDEISLSVTDSGRGISAEMLPHVFDLFAQEHQNLDRSQGGLGLGLAIVKSLVALHGGRVGVESKGVGHGSRFVVRLPASTGASVASTSIAGEASDADPAVVPPSRATILVVDDNEDAAIMLAETLEMMGYATQVAHDGAEALAQARGRVVPVVALLDIGLPSMDGYELARRLREIPGWDGVQLIAVTGYGQETDRQQSMDAGFNEHLVKPINLAGLRESLARIAS